MDQVAAARREAEARFDAGWRPVSLLTSENLKLKKGEKYGWRGMGLSLAPADMSGFEVCASRSPTCTQHCLFYTGNGRFFNAMWGRIFKSIWFFRDRDSFMEMLYRDIDRNQDAAIRLNVLSDIQWERMFPDLFSNFRKCQFYDYTKHAKRMFRDRPENYHLTFSLNENNAEQAQGVLRAGMNVAAVVKSQSGFLFGYPVIDGDDHDLRFLDPSPCVVGLKPKGSLRSALDREMIYAPDEFLQPAEAA